MYLFSGDSGKDGLALFALTVYKLSPLLAKLMGPIALFFLSGSFVFWLKKNFYFTLLFLIVFLFIALLITIIITLKYRKLVNMGQKNLVLKSNELTKAAENAMRQLASVDTLCNMALVSGEHPEKICPNVQRTLLYELIRVCLAGWSVEDKKACFLELNGDSIFVVAELGHEPGLTERVRSYFTGRYGMIAQTIRENCILQIADTWNPPAGIQYIRKSNPPKHRALFTAPVHAWNTDEKVAIGALCLTLNKPYQLSEWDINILDAFSLKAGEVCTKIRLVKGSCSHYQDTIKREGK